MRRLLLGASLFVSASQLQATILPPNDLDKEDQLDAETGITQKDFNDVIDEVSKLYAPIIKEHDASLKVEREWSNSTVNASASRSGKTWVVRMYGGLARRVEMTRDGFTMVLCHELGHHLGGFPTKGTHWAANEGQSDYFASQACAHKLWDDDLKKNAEARKLAPAAVKATCDDVYKDEPSQNLCYRTVLASKAVSDLLGALGKTKVAFDTPDKSVVKVTSNSHPKAQCRLDTYVAGAVCVKDFDHSQIPGLGKSAKEAEQEAAATSCHTAMQFTKGVRPLCWFKPGI